MKFFKNKLKGFGLAELVLAIGIFASISSVLLLLIIDSTRTLENSRDKIKAARMVEELNSTFLMIKSQSWFTVARHTNEGAMHFGFNNGSYELISGEGQKDSFTYSFSIQEAQRDSNGVTVATGGNIDPHTRMITIDIRWHDFLGKLHSIHPVIFINDWDTNSIVFTSYEDFLSGNHIGTMSQNVNGGELRLQSMFYADWCNPSLSMTSHDLPGQGIATNISTNAGIVYMGTGGNASGISFMKANVTGEPPVVVNEGTLDGYKVNDVYGINGVALLATDNNAQEAVLLDISTFPYAVIGSFDAQGTADGDAVFYYNNLGFVAHGTSLSIFNLSGYTGARSLIRTINLGATVTDIFVDANYVYLTLSNSTNDVVVYRYSPTFTLVGQAQLGAVSATSLFVSEDTNRVYIGTSSSSLPEFYILDTSTKTDTYPIVSSYEAGLLSIKGLASVDGRAILVGIGGEEYTVLDIKNESSPVRCGGLNVDTGVNALTLVKDGNNHYTYVVTRDASSEFKIIRGGPGGGGADGNGYLPSGTYLSSIFDSESTSSNYYILSLVSTVPAGTSLKLQLRASDSEIMSGSIWKGPDGTVNSYYEVSGIFELPSLFGRYFQYKAVLESDTVSTPLVEEIIINYEK